MAEPILPAPGLSRRGRETAPFRVMAILARARELEAAGRSVIHLEVGESRFPTPGPVLAAAREALAAGRTGYTPAAGLPALREAIAERYRRRHGVALDPERVLVTPGASGALLLALALVADPGEGVLLTDPGYPCFRQLARVLGLEARSLPLAAEAGYRPAPAAVAAAWEPGIRALLLASPANPTGAVLDREGLRELAAVAEARGGWLVMDETYAGLAYDGPAPTALEVAPRALVAGSFSKYFGMTGWRVGWLVVPESMEGAAERLAQNLFLAAPTLAQHAALAALDPEVEPELERRREVLRRNRDRLAEGLRELGFELPELPGGAFYLYVGCRRFCQDSETLARRLLEEAGVAVTPGTDFGEHRARERLRFAYTVSPEELDEALRRLRAFLAGRHPAGLQN